MFGPQTRDLLMTIPRRTEAVDLCANVPPCGSDKWTIDDTDRGHGHAPGCAGM